MDYNVEMIKPRLEENINNTVINFREGKDKEGYSKLLEVINQLERFIELLAKAGKTNEVEKMNADLSQALQAMENGDVVLLADYLEYKILPGIQDLN